MRTIMRDKGSYDLIRALESSDFSSEAGPLTNRFEWDEVKRRLMMAQQPLDSEPYTVEDGWVELHSGTRFFYREPTEDMVHLTDIANSLGKTARYAGHTHTFYSVAEHSCLMMRWARRNLLADLPLLRTILMHDATEAYLPDLPRPLKHMLPQFKDFEHRLERVISSKFGLLSPMPGIVHQLDSRILVDERRQAMNPSDNEWGIDSLAALGIDLELWAPHEAIDNFLGDALELGL